MNQVEVKRRQIEMISYLIGFVNLFIFGRLLGNTGMAYLAVAMEAFFVLETITAGAVSDALARILRGKNTKGQYKNAGTIRKRILMLQGISGAVGSLLLLVGAEAVSAFIFKVPNSTLIMAVLSPAVLLLSVSAALTGFFRGEGSELPGVVAALLRQVLLLGFGILWIHLMSGYGEKVSSLLGNEVYTALYGGVGAAIAFGLTELLIVLFLVVIYWGNRRTITKREKDAVKRKESFLDTARVFVGARGTDVLLLMLAQLPFWAGAVLSRMYLADAASFAESYGLLFRGYLTLSGLIILLILLLLVAPAARTVSLLRKEEHRHAAGSFQGGLQIGFALSLFFSVFTAVMADPIAAVWTRTGAEELTGMLRWGAGLIVLAVLGFYFTRLLLAAGRQYCVLGCLGGLDILFIMALTFFMKVGEAGISALVYAGLFGGTAYCAAAGFFCFRLLQTKWEWLRIFLFPIPSACVLGLLCMLLGKLCAPYLGNLLTAALSFLLTVPLYAAGLILLRCFKESELKYVPCGRLIRTMGQVMGVFGK